MLLQDRRHQTCRPDFTVADHFSVNRIGNAAVQQSGQTLQIVHKSADKRVCRFRRKQARYQIALIAA
ncbi:hypothetical protein D1872_318900 [compost metagenome]